MYIRNILFLLSILVLSVGCSQKISPSVVALDSKNKTYAEPENRCLQDKEWTEKNIAKWLNEPLERIIQVKKARSLDNIALCKLSSKKLAHSFHKLDNPERPDKPDKAASFRAQQQSVNGVVKPDGLIVAMQHRKRPVANTQLIGGAGISSEKWIDLGPGNIGGRTRAVYIHPQNTDIIFLGSVGGGIWKSINGGASWSVVDDFMANIVVTSIVADPRTTGNVDTTILYASTGEGFYNGDSLRGYGIFKSTDGGRTWNHLASTSPIDDSAWYYVNRLAVNSLGVIIAVTRDNAIFMSNDGGIGWIRNSPGPDYGTILEDVKFDPNDDSKAIVGSIGGNCYYTRDSGETWSKSTIVDTSASGWIAGRVEIAYAGASSNIVFASVDNNNGEIYRSTDGGINWFLQSNPKHLSSQGWYDNTIWVDPFNTSHLIIGGLDLHRSTDAGVNWTKISTWHYSPSSAHADHHMIINDPNYNGSSNKRIYFSNDGGIYKTEDITQVNAGSSNNGWNNLNNNFSVTQFYGVAGISGSKIIGGAQDNGSLIQSNGRDWSTHYGGDGGFSAVSKNPTISNNYYYFGEYVYLKIHRSDNGNHSGYIYNNISDAANYNANFIAPFILDPNDDNIMLAGGASLWRSTNVNASDPSSIYWTTIKDTLGKNISQIAIAEGNSDIILVGYNNGEIYVTSNGTSSSPVWSKIHNDNGKMVLALMVDKTDNSVFYAGWGGFTSGNLKKSIDSGASWVTISSNLPETPMRSIVRKPSNPNYLYVGTEVGIYTSEDQGNTWFNTNDGPANVSVDKLFWYDDNTLIAGTHGRGVFKLIIDSGQNNNTKINPAIINYLLN